MTPPEATASPPPALPPPAGRDIPDSAAALVRWFRVAARDLPWRTDRAGWDRVAEPGPAESGAGDRRDPYRTWIAEIMLQQTQVATVIAYFNRWMERFPDLASLAAAGEEEVLSLWAGLGYYSRARNLLATAREIEASHRGAFPRTREDLLRLKGIGEYTAGAIASLAFGRAEPILDGNLVRVFSRLYGLSFLPDAAEGRRTYWDLSRAWAQAGDPGFVNESLMELGALVCTPKTPDCGNCPLAGRCEAARSGSQERFPPAKPRKAPKVIRGYAAVIRCRSQVLLYTPRKGELLAGLPGFPIFPLSGVPAFSGLRKAWRNALPARPFPAFRPRIAVVTHGITHHQFRLGVVVADLEAVEARADWPEGYSWAAEDAVDKSLVSSFTRKIWEAGKPSP